MGHSFLLRGKISHHARYTLEASPGQAASIFIPAFETVAKGFYKSGDIFKTSCAQFVLTWSAWGRILRACTRDENVMMIAITKMILVLVMIMSIIMMTGDEHDDNQDNYEQGYHNYYDYH
jgi:hypothetical protein